MTGRSVRLQSGLTLVELMIALLIGLLVSAMVLQYMVGSSRIFARQSAGNMVESNARFAMSYLTQFLRQAGTRDSFGTEVPFYIDDCGAWNPCTADGTGAVSDRVAVQMFPDDGMDCTGNAVPPGSSVANVFYIGAARAGNALFCRGYDVMRSQWLGPGLALVDGIEQMQLLYGVADGSEQIYSYLSAGNVPAVNGSPLEGWDRVRSVKLGLLVSDGTGRSSERMSSNSFQLFDASAVSFNDRIYRRSFTTTVMINNKMQ